MRRQPAEIASTLVGVLNLLLIPMALFFLFVIVWINDSPIRNSNAYTAWLALVGLVGLLNFMVLRRPPGRLWSPAFAIDVALIACGGAFWIEHCREYPTLAPPFEAGLSLAVAIVNLLCLLLRKGIRPFVRGTVLLGTFILGAGVLAVPYARTRLARYEAQRPAILRIKELLGNPPLWEGYWMSWDDWWIVGLHLKAERVSDADLEFLKILPRLRSLTLSGTQVSDAGMEFVGSVNGLESLYLDDTRITDRGLERLKGLTNLRHQLWLNGTKITDEGLKHLSGMTCLQGLYLGGTGVTDAGFQHLTHLQNLYYLHLVGTKVTADGIQQFQSLMPGCTVGAHDRYYDRLR